MFPTQTLGPQATARDTSYGMSGSTTGGHSIGRGGARGGPHASGGHRVCYVVLDKAEVEAFDAVIIGMVPGHHYLATI